MCLTDSLNLSQVLTICGKSGETLSFNALTKLLIETLHSKNRASNKSINFRQNATFGSVGLAGHRPHRTSVSASFKHEQKQIWHSLWIPGKNQLLK